MITRLYIRDFTLIDRLDIEFRPGFSVITGETGAGKSIILGAIALLTGARADTKAIKQGAARSVIEAHFDLTRYPMPDFFADNGIDYEPSDCIIRREITSAGKSRAFVNDTPVPLTVLKELGEKLIDVHSQHKNLLLGRQDFQLEVVDIIAADADLLTQYRANYQLYNRARRDLDTLRRQIEQDAAKADFLRFQHDELDAAKLTGDEQETLEADAERMDHSEEIKSALYAADNSLAADETGAIAQLRTAADSLRDIASVLPAAPELEERLRESLIEIKDIAGELGRELSHVDFDPAELDKVNRRLDTLYTLEKKYRCQNDNELIVLRDSLAAKLSDIDNQDDRLADQKAEVDRLAALCTEQADSLTAKRREAAAAVEREMLTRLAELGMPNVRFHVRLTKSQLTSTGADQVAFLFSANRSTEPQPVETVASGGEIARVMLSLKAMISSVVKLPTIIFDEIDTGVSGKIAERMALIMRQMGADSRQVVSITHLPQIAGRGTTHYKVVKEETPEGTVSRMTMLTPEERVAEIAQMLSGSDITDAALNNARELLK